MRRRPLPASRTCLEVSGSGATPFGVRIIVAELVEPTQGGASLTLGLICIPFGVGGSELKLLDPEFVQFPMR